MGFSPPRKGCHRSGLAWRSRTNPRNATKKRASPKSNNRQCSLKNPAISCQRSARVAADIMAITAMPV